MKSCTSVILVGTFLNFLSRFHENFLLLLREKHLLSGIPSSPPYGSLTGNGPTASAGNLPITANFGNKNQKMNVRTIAIIALSAFVLLLVLLGAISLFIKWRKVANPSSVVGPGFGSSIHKRSGKTIGFLCLDVLNVYFIICQFKCNLLQYSCVLRFALQLAI